jgi:hypothetical protein
MRRQDPVPPLLVKVIELTRFAVLGAVLGFLCGVAIGADVIGSDAFTSPEAQSYIVWSALRTGALLGAFYLPAAALLLAPRKLDPKLIGVASVAAIVFGFVGDAAMGPWAPPSFAASFGFWLTLFAVYQHDHRRTSGRGTYLP